ncbi:MAG: hypothetical protein WAM30_13040 [Candidatus Dormiibacterota bacterium]
MARRIGATFSARHARELGLEADRAFDEVLALGLNPLRLCLYWDEPDGGLEDLAWQLEAAERAGREVLLTVGMKAPRWPEFYLPGRLGVDRPPGIDIGAVPAVHDAVLVQLGIAVERVRGCAAIRWWQVENEPLNRSGPHRWWIGPQVLQQEVDRVRELDPRPIVLTAFGHFDRGLDIASGHSSLHNLAAIRGEGSGVEREVVPLLRTGDVLGIDLYRAIGGHLAGRSIVHHAKDTTGYAQRERERATALGLECWVTELQAEPWEADSSTLWDPVSVGPADTMPALQATLGVGIDVVLLWGVEYWLGQAARGDRTWLEAGRALLDLV